jgi:hypothetical protein
MKDTRSEALQPLRDMIIVGNLMAMKLGQEPTNLVNTWDEVVIRLRESGILQQVALADITVSKTDDAYKARLNAVKP